MSKRSFIHAACGDATSGRERGKKRRARKTEHFQIALAVEAGRDGAAYPRAHRCARVLVYEDGGRVARADAAAVGAQLLVRRAHDEGAVDLALLHFAQLHRPVVLHDRDDELRVHVARRPLAHAADDGDAAHEFRAGVVRHGQDGAHLDHGGSGWNGTERRVKVARRLLWT